MAEELTKQNIPNSGTLSLPIYFFAKKYRPAPASRRFYLYLRFNFLFIYRQHFAVSLL